VLTAALAQGIGWRTAYERQDFLMQDAPDDMFSAACDLLPDRGGNLAETVSALHTPMHPHCYLSPTVFAAKFGLAAVRGRHALRGALGRPRASPTALAAKFAEAPVREIRGGRGALGGPRVLLGRLREVMGETVSAQERLDKMMALIAANMVAEACSLYVLRVDGMLELYATEGLKREAVHRTVLRFDEGLAGLVASEGNPINLSDASDHSAFPNHTETGEEIYRSFLGVPVLRAGNTLGVLVVQNRARRTYTEEEEEALQTTAMVLAEMIASGELSAIAKPGAEPAARRPLHLVGTALNEGIALGHVVLHEPRAVISNLIADDVPRELKCLEVAIESMRSEFDVLIERREIAEEHRDVLEAYRLFAYDRGWVHRLEEAVATGLTAKAAVERVQSDTRARMLRATDPYLRERLDDLHELANCLMDQLIGPDSSAPARERLPENAVLIAHSMGPAALGKYDRNRLRGLVLEEGGLNSHITILARELGIAAIGGVPNATVLVYPGDPIIVDGAAGDVHIRPSPETEAAYVERVRLPTFARA
jgi:phosphotransferase system enzyme I (PtsP)